MRTRCEFADWRNIRRALCLSQCDMAALIMVTRVGYQKLERRGANPREVTVVMLRQQLLAEPELRERLRQAGYPYPWPSDLEAAGLAS